jgi:hypothetical protein
VASLHADRQAPPILAFILISVLNILTIQRLKSFIYNYFFLEDIMSRKNCFIKISGDMICDEAFEWVKKLSNEYFIVLCIGGGTQINDAFKLAGLISDNFGPLGRETKNFHERQLARDILEKNQADVQDRLDSLGIRVNVVMPVIYIGTVLCHVNGDQYILTAYHGFDVLFVLTTDSRVAAKQKFFEPYTKIKVLGLKDI